MDVLGRIRRRVEKPVFIEKQFALITLSSGGTREGSWGGGEGGGERRGEGRGGERGGGEEVGGGGEEGRGGGHALRLSLLQTRELISLRRCTPIHCLCNAFTVRQSPQSPGGTGLNLVTQRDIITDTLVAPETLYHRDDALLYVAYVMLIWAAHIPADRWQCSLWPQLTPWVDWHTL